MTTVSNGLVLLSVFWLCLGSVKLLLAHVNPEPIEPPAMLSVLMDLTFDFFIAALVLAIRLLLGGVQ